MSRETPPSAVEPQAVGWHELDAVLEEIARLSQVDVAARDFHAEFLSRVVSSLSAAGGSIWTAGPGQPHLEYRITPAGTPATDDLRAEVPLQRLAAAAIEAGRPKLIAPRSGPDQGDSGANPTDYLLLVCPWSLDGDVAGAVEVFLHPGAGPETECGSLRFLEAMCELLADYHRNRQLREYRRRAGMWRHLDQFAQRVHGSLDLRATAYAIANESRRLLGCDRVSVLVRRSAKCRLIAVSGVDSVNRRAGVVQQLERLATAVATFDEPLWHPGSSADRPPEIGSRLDAYLDESHARAIALIPMKLSKEQVDEPPRLALAQTRWTTPGVLVVEQFSGQFDDRLPEMAASLLPHSALALAAALELDSVPMARVLRTLGRVRWFVEASRLPKTFLVLLATITLAALLALIPADFRVEARGELQPSAARDVFATADGVVGEIRAAHGQMVHAGEVLLVLREPELDLEFKRIWGELQRARTKLASVETERLQNPRDTEENRRRYGELTAQHEELRELIASLEAQYAILQQRQAELEVRSPIDGEVLTWDLEQLLAARPVNRGQALMTVADLKGPWRIELRIPDRRVAHVLAARRQSGEPLGVAFVVAGEPSVQHEGKLAWVGMRTEITEADGAFVPARVDIDYRKIPDLMPGATVTAKIDCGRRPVGYVWLHDLVDAVRVWFLF